MAANEGTDGPGLRFRHLVLAGLESFGLGEPLRFADGLTWISTGEGVYERSIAPALRGRFGAERVHVEGAAGPGVPAWIGFLDHDVRLPYGATPWAPLADLLASPHGERLDHSQLARDVGEGVTQMLAGKFAGSSKFIGLVQAGDAVTATVSTDGAVRIFHGPTGRSLDYGFQASGERHVLSLALNRALRRQLGRPFDVPLVVDCRLGDMDFEVLSGMVTCIGTTGAQQIVIDSAACCEELAIEPHYEIKADRRTGRWRVVPRLRL